MLAQGRVAFAAALYIVAREQSIPVNQVTRGQVEQLKVAWLRPVAVWEQRLRALGVDLDDPTDPIAVW